MSQYKITIFQILQRLIGKQNLQILYRKICVERLKRAGCVFVHIPKSAGTSVAEVVIGKRAGHFSALELRKSMGPAVYDSFFSFTVTRHPVERLKSAYMYARNGGGSQGGIEPHPDYRGGKFRSFEAFVNEWLVCQNLEEIDYVFRPQTGYVFHKGTCLVNYVGSVEKMTELEKKLEKELGRIIIIPKRNQALPSRAIVSPPDRETLNVIRKLYLEDFELFGYEVEDYDE